MDKMDKVDFNYDFLKDIESQNILESRGWGWEVNDMELIITWHLSNGSEYSFYTDRLSFLSDITVLKESFDVDEYVKMFINNLGEDGVPSTVKELLEDAEVIKEELKALDDAINFPEMYNKRYNMGHIGGLRIYRNNITNTFLVCRGEGAEEEILDEENDLHALLFNIGLYYIGLI